MKRASHSLALRVGFVVASSALALTAGCNMGSDSSKKVTSDPAAASNAAKPAASGPLLIGAPITEKAIPLSEIAKNAHAYENKTVATSGTVFAVCQSMGCWMEIKDDASEAHVKLAGHSFFVPKTASGHKARVQAKVLKTNPDDECAKEAAEQTGKPVAKLELEATGVELD
jgi:hypothetical protein